MGKNNPILAEAELGFATDENFMKIGDGITKWNDLSVFISASQNQVMTLDNGIKINDDWAMSHFDDILLGITDKLRAHIIDIDKNNMIALIHFTFGNSEAQSYTLSHNKHRIGSTNSGQQKPYAASFLVTVPFDSNGIPQCQYTINEN